MYTCFMNPELGLARWLAGEYNRWTRPDLWTLTSDSTGQYKPLPPPILCPMHSWTINDMVVRDEDRGEECGRGQWMVNGQ